MIRHSCEPHHHEHFRKLGLKGELPAEIHTDEHEYSVDCQAWRNTLPHADEDEIHKRALGNAATRRLANGSPVIERRESAPDFSEVVSGHKQLAKLAWAIIGLMGLLILATLFAPKAHGQFSHINTITTKQGGSGVGFHASPFIINCGANLTCTDDGTTFNLVAGSGATVSWDAILAPTAGGLSLQVFANGNTFFTVKRKTDTAPTGNFFDFQNAASGSLCKLDITGAFIGCAFPYANLSGTPSTFAPTAHNLFSAQHGDTVAHTPVLGDLPFANSTPAWDSLAGNITSIKKYLSQTGTGTISAAPVWAQVSYADLSGTPTLPANTTATASNFFTAYNSSTGAFTKAQPAFTDISGSVAAGQMPALTGAVTSSAGTVATSLATKYSTLTCDTGLGDGLNAIAAGTYLQSTCRNETGATLTISAIRCFTDNSGSSTLNVTNDAATALLTGAVTCTSSYANGTQSGTTTLAANGYFKFTFVADGTSKQTDWVVVTTR